jgi:hypothetical protein
MPPEETNESATAATTEAASANAAASAASAASGTAAADAAAAGSAAAAAAAAGTPPADEAATTVPEKYDLKVPEGSNVDASFVERTAATARELGLSNEAAQKHLDQRVADVTTAREEGRSLERAAAAAAWTPDTGAKWLEHNEAQKAACLKDPEIGGSPEKLQATVELANTVIRNLGTPALIAKMQQGSFASDPDVVRFLAKIGRSMSEGTLKLAGTTRTTAATEEERLARRYPTMAAKS